MTYYADTSWWLGFKLRNDAHHDSASALFDHDEDAEVLWTPWQRVEVFNGLFQLERLGALDPGEARDAVRRFEKEVQMGYWPHREFRWIDATRIACQLAEVHGLKMGIRGMDLFHVAVALTVRAGAFLTFDDEQKKLVRATGLEVKEF